MDFGLGGLGHDGGIGDHGLEHCWHSPILRLSMPNFYHSHHFYFDQYGIFLMDEVNLMTILEVDFEVQIYSKNWKVWNSICHLILKTNPGKIKKKIVIVIAVLKFRANVSWSHKQKYCNFIKLMATLCFFYTLVQYMNICVWFVLRSWGLGFFVTTQEIALDCR